MAGTNGSVPIIKSQVRLRQVVLRPYFIQGEDRLELDGEKRSQEEKKTRNGNSPVGQKRGKSSVD